MSITDTIKRLAEARAATHDTHQREGHSAGLAWSRDEASYTELRSYAEEVEEAGGRYAPRLPESAWAYFDELEDEESFREGWDGPVTEVWHAIKAEVEAGALSIEDE